MRSPHLPPRPQDPNIKYLALENLSRLALLPDVLEAIRHNQATVILSLKVGGWGMGGGGRGCRGGLKVGGWGKAGGGRGR